MAFDSEVVLLMSDFFRSALCTAIANHHFLPKLSTSPTSSFDLPEAILDICDDFHPLSATLTSIPSMIRGGEAHWRSCNVAILLWLCTVVGT